MTDPLEESMKAAVARAMGEPALAPEALRARVAAIVAHSGGGAATARRRRLKGWTPLVAAAMLLIAAAGVWFLWTAAGPSQPGDHHALVPAAMVQRFGARHEVCTADVGRLYQATRFPDRVERLPDALAAYFHESMQGVTLDLSELGYRYRATGVCSLPGRGAAHITYVSASDALSLWMRRDDGRLAIEEGQLYAPGEHAEHPMLIWRRGEMIFYLVGDARQRVDQAAAILRARS